jgi:hypothetical protein
MRIRLPKKQRWSSQDLDAPTPQAEVDWERVGDFLWVAIVILAVVLGGIFAIFSGQWEPFPLIRRR